MNIYLLTAFAILQLADGYTTWRILSAGGQELNPLLVRLMTRFGLVPALIVAKGGAAVVMVAAVLGAEYGADLLAGHRLADVVRMTTYLVLCLTVAGYAAVVVHNLTELQQQSET